MSLLQQWARTLTRPMGSPFIARPLLQSAIQPALVSPSLTLMRTMKVRASVKKICDGCSTVKRRGKVFVVCSKNKKHKQRQG
ncbi:hypothetical protein INT44_000404 [Umbelopsis vinacea]|uniref:Ribosomal protein n=2 Tax=Umbelopsis TaxID=64561 RepID=A0A8H7U8G9_9FUNG|nr:hypothetical protein INT44_000404 [Umbelopsis vinacea]KAI9284692.1 ribosomal protein L36-domain-containing protein [Umbelopsis sp. AD052]